MRRRLAVLGTTTSMMLVVAVLAAAPAEARRNVGGSVPEDSVCVFPGNSANGSAQAAAVVPCVCIVVPGGEPRRNVGGTGPADGSCPPGLTTTSP